MSSAIGTLFTSRCPHCRQSGIFSGIYAIKERCDVCGAVFLRDEGNWTPILMLTAKDGELDEAEGLETGADDYLTKPFSYVILLARIRSLIRRSGAAPTSDILSVGDLHLDVTAHAVRRGDTAVEMSPRALAVLEYLMRNADRVVAKDDILANVWDHAFDGDPNIVEVYVSRIRAAVRGPALRTRATKGSTP